ncbi:hypothetical protein [Fontivita pretiosa]|uniref:hypothetical protein n=1 Tax=Fontivita pretiosa TaxID=2989684 RepID=UPI003D16B774
MSDAVAAKFACDACGKSYAWKPEIAGKRARCKCGAVMMVPAQAPGAQPQAAAEDEGLYDMAPAPEPPKPKKARLPLAPLPPKGSSAGDSPRAAAAVAAMAAPGIPAALGYRSSPQAVKDRFSSATLVDVKRDIHVPVALLLIGFAMYVGYYVFRHNLSGSGIILISLGVGMITLFKAMLLIGFAMVIAAPLGVSFGGPFAAALKLAAIAVFSDGISTWVEAGVDKMAGSSGMFGYMLSFPIALGTYWILLTYLFSMDSGDSWLVVMLLAVFDMIVRWALLFLLLALVLNWGGAAASALPASAVGAGAVGSGSGSGGSASAQHQEMIEEVRALKEGNALEEARKYIAGGRQAALGPWVDEWYAAGCKNVWFEVTRDINGKSTPETLIVELPRDKAARAKCFEIYKRYLAGFNEGSELEDLKDDGKPYLLISL